MSRIVRVPRSSSISAPAHFATFGESTGYFSKPISSNQRPAALRYSQGWVESRITRGSVRMVCDGMSEESSACPPDPGMAIAFGQVEHRGLAGKESQVDSCLPRWRRMAAEYRIILPAPLIQVPARGYCVCCLGCGKQRRVPFLLLTSYEKHLSSEL